MPMGKTKYSATKSQGDHAGGAKGYGKNKGVGPTGKNTAAASSMKSGNERYKSMGKKSY